VLRRIPRNAGRTVPTNTTTSATPPTIATCVHVSRGCGGPEDRDRRLGDHRREQQTDADADRRRDGGHHPVLEQEREDDLLRGHANGLERADLTDAGGHPSGHQHRRRRDREDGDQESRGQQRAGHDVDVRMRVRAPFLPRLEEGDRRRVWIRAKRRTVPVHERGRVERIAEPQLQLEPLHGHAEIPHPIRRPRGDPHLRRPGQRESPARDRGRNAEDREGLSLDRHGVPGLRAERRREAAL
jgi:hypothetical protein